VCTERSEASLTLAERAVGVVSKPDVVDAADAPLDVGVDAAERRRQTVGAALEQRGLLGHHVRISAADHCMPASATNRAAAIRYDTLYLRAPKSWRIASSIFRTEPKKHKTKNVGQCPT